MNPTRWKRRVSRSPQAAPSRGGHRFWLEPLEVRCVLDLRSITGFGNTLAPPTWGQAGTALMGTTQQRDIKPSQELSPIAPGWHPSEISHSLTTACLPPESWADRSSRRPGAFPPKSRTHRAGNAGAILEGFQQSLSPSTSVTPATVAGCVHDEPHAQVSTGYDGLSTLVGLYPLLLWLGPLWAQEFVSPPSQGNPRAPGPRGGTSDRYGRRAWGPGRAGAGWPPPGWRLQFGNLLTHGRPWMR
jgi:hypothetical protein